MIKYSVILPVYNEIKVLPNCLASLEKQTVSKDMEIIVVDDGSSDGTESRILNLESRIILFKQNHKGAGAARNFGAKQAKGEILVFVDADMEFAPDFIAKLCRPIGNDVIGTYSTQELLLNKDKQLARYWNLNFGRSIDKMEPRGYAKKPGKIYGTLKSLLEQVEGDKAGEERNKVFRAILRSEFEKAGGFDPSVGYTDDWTIAEKLNKFPVAVDDAVYYHRSPESYGEVWRQARWFGKNEFLTKNLVRKIFNLFRYCPLMAFARLPDFGFFKFQLVFNLAVFTSVCLSFLGENKNK